MNTMSMVEGLAVLGWVCVLAALVTAAWAAGDELRWFEARGRRHAAHRREIMRLMYAPSENVTYCNSVRWNPWNKVVQDHRNGAIDHQATDWVRKELGLPVPWVPEMAESEVKQPPVYL